MFGIWIPLAIVIVVASSGIGTNYRTELSMPSGDASQAESLLQSANPNQGGFASQLVFKSSKTVDDPAVKKIIEDAITAVKAIGGIDTNNPFATPGQINQDRTVAFAQLNVARVTEEEITEIGKQIKSATSFVKKSDVTIAYGGEIFEVFALPESEALGILAAIVILVLAFGSIIAMGLPIGIALIGLIIAASIVGLVSNTMSIPDAASSMVAMIGLGVGIDYA